jgi:hypothetical protein
MDQALAAGWVLAFGMLFLVLLRSRLVPVPVLAGRAPPPARPGDDEEEQLPETDRAPRPWLPLSVAAVAALRLVLLVTLHA